MGKRTWFKVLSDKWIEGTIRQESPELRGIWIDILALASSMNYGDIGEIKLANNIGLTDQQICDILYLNQEIWLKNKVILIDSRRIKVKKSNVIAIKNWSKYQSEYQRQRGYRQNGSNLKLQPKVTTKVTDQSYAREVDREVDREKKIYKRKILIPDNYKLNQEHIDYAKSKNITDDIKDIFEGFCIHHKKKGNKYVDWNMAWQTWIRKKIGFNKQNYIAKAQEPDKAAQQERDAIDRQFTDEKLRANRVRLGAIVKGVVKKG